jgi:hypothetical protein
MKAHCFSFLCQNTIIYLAVLFLVQLQGTHQVDVTIELYNDQRNAQSAGYGVSVRAVLSRTLTPYPADLNHCRICTPASEDGLKESPKHVRQK